MTDVKGKIVLITGASSGIGKACAIEFAKSGANLLLVARRIDRIVKLSDELARQYKIKTKSVRLDVRNYDDVKNLYNKLENYWKNVDIILNNAGLARGLSKIYEGDTEHWEEMIDTNIKGLLYITRTFLPQMVEKMKGHIINIGSTAGHETYAFGNVYSATKFAVKALSQSIRLDVLDKGIKVTSVDPGMVITEFSKVRFSGDDARANKVYDGIEPLNAKDVADAVIFVATRPQNVNINQIIITPIQQASSTQVYRK
ncbi:MAG TPA: SDR family NAD(P)-dependent oxidoreductase [Ignavibacteriaceae bacterium]|nr:SDR family NAD(P)-dependent oxidoreductase [Ignavibacteriaceae bacterium]